MTASPPAAPGMPSEETIARLLFDRGRNIHDAASWEEAGDEMREWLRGHSRAILSLIRPAFEAQERERDEARQIVRDIYWMALRYADGRQTYAPGMCNDALRKAYDGGWLVHRHQSDPAFARDGSSPEYHSLEARALSAEAKLAQAVEAMTTAHVAMTLAAALPSVSSEYDFSDAIAGTEAVLRAHSASAAARGET